MSVQTNISEEDRRSATSVTASGSGHKFEIQLGHLCNNRCVFCSSGQLTAMKVARPVPLEQILEALDEARANGATHLTFLGGEPTIHKGFLIALAKAVDLGFERIVIFTNGVMFPHPGFIESVLALGNFEWRISIQGATEEAHVATTERPQSFQRILHGLGVLQTNGQLVTANMCVNDRSYESLPAYPELLKKYGVKQLHVDIVRPESTGERDEDYLRELMPRYSLMAPYYDEMLAGFESWDPDFDINVGNLPYCVLPKWGSRVHHGGQATVTKSSDSTGLEDAMNKYEWQASLRTHLPRCEECVFRSRCTGIFRVYLELHSDEEFQPVSREQLLAIDPERSNFVLLSEPLLAPLRAAVAAESLPTGWRHRREVTEDRRRLVEMEFEHKSGQPLRLRIVRPGAAPSAVIATRDYDLEAEADLAMPIESLGELFEWLRARLDEGTEETVALAADAIERTLRSSVMARGRKRVMLLAGRVQSRFDLSGWQLGELCWPAEGVAEVTARGPKSASVALRFSLGSRDNRTQVGVDFQVAEGSDHETVKPAVDRIVSLLREPRSASAGAPASV